MHILILYAWRVFIKWKVRVGNQLLNDSQLIFLSQCHDLVPVSFFNVFIIHVIGAGERKWKQKADLVKITENLFVCTYNIKKEKKITVLCSTVNFYHIKNRIGNIKMLGISCNSNVKGISSSILYYYYSCALWKIIKMGKNARWLLFLNI